MKGNFGWPKISFLKWCTEEENVKKIGQFSGTNTLQAAKWIFFNFDTWIHAYERHIFNIKVIILLQSIKIWK